MPVECNVSDIKNFPMSNNKKELERFMGMVEYYREFIKGMTELYEPLNRLTLFHMKRADSTCLQIVFFMTSVRDAAEPRHLVTFPKI